MASYNALNSKIGVLRRGILEYEDYEKILSLSTREEILNYLKVNPIYEKEITLMYQEALANRNVTEFMMKKTEVDIFRKLEHFLLGRDKELVSAMLTRYEFEDIKVILRSIVEKESLNLEKDMLMYGLENHVNYERLYKCENINQAMDILKNSAFKRAFIGLVDEDVLRLHFHVEMNLDGLYFQMVRKAYLHLSKVDRLILEDYYSTLVDTINIQWIIRAKKYYKLTNEEIFIYCIRYGKYIKGELLKSLVYSQSVEGVVDKLKNTKLGRLFIDSESKLSAYRDIQAFVYGEQLHHLKSYQDSISTFLKFIIQILIQNENLIRIAESNKYGLDKEDTEKYLILIK